MSRYFIIDGIVLICVVLLNRVLLEQPAIINGLHGDALIDQWPPPLCANDNDSLHHQQCPFEYSFPRPSVETIPTHANTLLTYAMPMLVIIITIVFFTPTTKAWSDFWTATFALVGGREFTSLFTVCLKHYIAWKRPYWYNDGRLDSLPSAHASTAFAGLTFLSLYLFNKTRKDSIVACTAFVLIPYALATFIAASRVVDHVHHPIDVLSGALLGYHTARVFYRLYLNKQKPSVTMSTVGDTNQQLAGALSVL